jgi:gliding motility-associated-like protein
MNKNSHYRYPTEFGLYRAEASGKISIIESGGDILCGADFITLFWKPDFLLHVSPSFITLKPGESEDLQVWYDSFEGYNEWVNLSEYPLRSDITFNFSPESIDSSLISVLNIHAGLQATPGIYPYTILGQSGSKADTASLTVEVLDYIDSIRPNPFTPNGDGFNDYVTFNLFDLKVYGGTISIYDIWGKEIRRIENGMIWDGRNDQGSTVIPGSYLYIIECQGEVISKGILGLVR